MLTAVATTSKPLVYPRGWCQPHRPPPPPELAFPQILATVLTRENLGPVENLSELTFPDGHPEGRGPWPILMFLSAKFEKQKACVQFLWRACQNTDSWALPPGGSDANMVGVWSEIFSVNSPLPY